MKFECYPCIVFCSNYNYSISRFSLLPEYMTCSQRNQRPAVPRLQDWMSSTHCRALQTPTGVYRQTLMMLWWMWSVSDWPQWPGSRWRHSSVDRVPLVLHCDNKTNSIIISVTTNHSRTLRNVYVVASDLVKNRFLITLMYPQLC